MKTALITGGARGIGRIIAQDLAKDHNVAFTWHKTEPQKSSDTMLALKADLTRADAAPAIITSVIERFGQIDCIINNAGLIATSPIEEQTPESAHDLMALHVGVPAALLACALPHLKRGASLVNISSINADLPPKGAAMYGASKAAQDLWTRAMAKELGPKGIRVNAVAPGAINIDEAPRPDELTKAFTDLTALGQLATAQDIADAVRFLSSDAAKSITGQILRVCGGYRL